MKTGLCQTSKGPGMSEASIMNVNLCDCAQEPSDEGLARLMDCVARDAVVENREALEKLYLKLEQETRAVTGQAHAKV